MHREDVELICTHQAIDDSVRPVNDLPNLANPELGYDTPGLRE